MHAADYQIMAHIEASRPARMRRTWALITSALSALVLLAAAGGWLIESYLSRQLPTVNAGTTGTMVSGPLNVLVAGVDIRAGLTRHQQVLLHVGHATGHNSDTLMLVHIAADERHVQVVSLPRDSWVRIPGFGMNKINAAIGLGGPALMVRTVEQATGLTVNDFVEVDFLGFVKIIDALGGVDVCVPYRVDDPYSGLRLSAGRHHVDGITALEFARDRHSFALSDLARISDQQQLISSVLTKASSSGTLTDPVRFSRFLAAATSAVRVDSKLNVVQLAEHLRFVRPGAVTFTTVPVADFGYLTPTGESAVLWNDSAARALFTRIRNDELAHPNRPRPGHSRAQAGQAGAGQSHSRTAAQAACR